MATAVDIPTFPEGNHTLVQSLQHLSDGELVSLFNAHPEEGRYFTAIFCRYTPIVYSLIRHSTRSPVQADYLFALTWQHILYELGGVDTQAKVGSSGFTLQQWLVNLTAFCINQVTLPEVPAIQYRLDQVSPPFWCYLHRALDRLHPLERLMLVMAHSFGWSHTRMLAYLQAEGEYLKPEQLQHHLELAHQHLLEALPVDICRLYLPDHASVEAVETLDQWLSSPDWLMSGEGARLATS
jgi:hypothetical protein